MPPIKREGSIDSDDEGCGKLDTFVAPSAPTHLSPSVKRARLVRKRPASSITTSGGSSYTSTTATPAKKRKTVQKPKVVKNDLKIIFGLDFGTTFSGMSFLHSGSPNEIQVLMGIDTISKMVEKVPSAMQFSDSDDLQIESWGNRALHDPSSLKWFKLLLLKEEDLSDEIRDSEHLQEARDQLEELEVTAEEVIGQYLKQLWEASLKKVKARILDETVDMSRFHVVVTLPAIWPEYAKQGMKAAVRFAGILKDRPGVSRTVVSFISEPEAAALASMDRLNHLDEPRLGLIKRNDCFVVCDAGGGTVDIISYKVNSTEPMEVREVVSGDGALCGAIYVDQEFIRLLITKFAEVHSLPWDKIEPEEDLMELMHTWHSRRDEFDGTGRNAEDWKVRVPDSLLQPDHNGARPKVVITAQDMATIFKLSVDRIKSMIGEQVSAIKEAQGKLPRYIFLVGGYGSSPYLCALLREQFSDIKVDQDHGGKPWSAVSRGAVIHGLMSAKLPSERSVKVKTRVSRASFGVEGQEDFDPLKHDAKDKVWDKDLRRNVVRNVMKWFIKKGEDTEAVGTFEYRLFKTLRKEPKTFKSTIWMCNKVRPPAYKDASVTKFSDLSWRPKIKLDALPLVHEGDDGEDNPAYKLEYLAEMKWGNGSAEFAIIHNGKRQGTRTVSVEFHDQAAV